MKKTKAELGLCSTVGCRESSRARGLCIPHYCAWWREERLMDPDREPRCEYCDGPHHAYDMCRLCYLAWMRYGDPTYRRPPMPEACSVKECPRKPKRIGWCEMHHQRVLLHGDPLVTGKRGAKPRLLQIPERIRALSSAYVYSYTTGAERTEEQRVAHNEYNRLRKELARV